MTAPRDVRDMSKRDLELLVDRQSDAIQRARSALERVPPKVQNAIAILNIACPRLTIREDPPK
jgi:hypothetical protein